MRATIGNVSFFITIISLLMVLHLASFVLRPKQVRTESQTCAIPDNSDPRFRLLQSAGLAAGHVRI